MGFSVAHHSYLLESPWLASLVFWKNARVRALTLQCVEDLMNAQMRGPVGTCRHLLSGSGAWADFQYENILMDTCLCMPWPLSILLSEGKFSTIGFSSSEHWPRNSSFQCYMFQWNQDCELALQAHDQHGIDDQHVELNQDAGQLFLPQQFQNLADFLRNNFQTLTPHHDDDAEMILDMQIQWLQR